MAGSFLAEVFKLRKRPVVWILGGVWLAILIILVYLLPALLLAAVAAGAPSEARMGLEDQFATFAPQNLSTLLLRFLFPSFGTAVALILGAVVVGSEYRWGTLKVVLSQRPGRLGFLSGKLLALGALLLLFVLAAFLVGAVSSLIAALALGASPAPPAAVELLEGLGIGALILVVWAALGFALATLFRSTALALVVGLLYAFAFEPMFASLSGLNESLQEIVGLLPGVNTSALALTFAETAGDMMLNPALGGGPGLGRSALVLGAYALIFLVITTLVFWRRDVT